MQGGNLSLRSPFWLILLHSGQKTQDFKSSPRHYSFWFPRGLDLRFPSGWLNGLLDRDFPIRTCFSVDGFGSLKRLQALFVLPKSTKPSTPFSSQWKGPTVKTVCTKAFFFFPAVKDWLLFLFEYVFFLLLFPLLLLFLSGCMLKDPAIAKLQNKNPGEGNAKSMGSFMVDVDVVRFKKKSLFFHDKKEFVCVCVCAGGERFLLLWLYNVPKSHFKQQLQNNWVAHFHNHACQHLLEGSWKKNLIYMTFISLILHLCSC